MIQKSFMQGLISGILAAVAGVIYMKIYQNALGPDFHKIVNIGNIAGGAIFACMLFGLLSWLLEKFNMLKLKGWFYIVIAVLSFASIIYPISISLPLDIQNPELFPGLVIPMHFFPALAYFTIEPFFNKGN